LCASSRRTCCARGARHANVFAARGVDTSRLVLVRAERVWRIKRDCTRRTMTRRRIGSERAPARTTIQTKCALQHDMFASITARKFRSLRYTHRVLAMSSIAMPRFLWKTTSCTPGLSLFEIGDAGHSRVACCLSWHCDLARDMSSTSARSVRNRLGCRLRRRHRTQARCGPWSG